MGLFCIDEGYTVESALKAALGNLELLKSNPNTDHLYSFTFINLLNAVDRRNSFKSNVPGLYDLVALLSKSFCNCGSITIHHHKDCLSLIRNEKLSTINKDIGKLNIRGFMEIVNKSDKDKANERALLYKENKTISRGFIIKMVELLTLAIKDDKSSVIDIYSNLIIAELSHIQKYCIIGIYENYDYVGGNIVDIRNTLVDLGILNLHVADGNHVYSTTPVASVLYKLIKQTKECISL